MACHAALQHHDQNRLRLTCHTVVGVGQQPCHKSAARILGTQINIVCNHFCVEQYIELLDGLWRDTVLHTVSLQIAALNLN